MTMKIALAGNPNSGKTTLFNALTGSNQYVGNWPGVTVEKKEGRLKTHRDVVLVDLPGIYSLSPYSLEEVVARNYLIDERPDAIINIVDGTNFERNLYLTTQLAELEIPMVIAINMVDIVRKNGDAIDLKKLSAAFSCEVVEISALKLTGIKEVAQKAISAATKKKILAQKKIFNDKIEDAIEKIQGLLPDEITNLQRFYAIKLFEKDNKIIDKLQNNFSINDITDSVEEEYDDDTESIIINERYNYIETIVNDCFTKKNKGITASQKIDKIVTNKWLALPIFALIMFAVYFVSITTVGTWITDWTNDVLFGEIVPVAAENFLVGVGTAPWLIDLIVNGIIAGVGAVLGFVPQMLVLFLFLAFLEDCGYMARIAFILDKIFRKFGLSGKSFIPMLIGTGCSVPGIMASRTIENENHRRMTIITTSFMPCSAKLPIIALITGSLFRDAWWVAPSTYFVGIAAILLSGIILKKFKAFIGNPTPFVMELPAYHMPPAGNLLHSMWERGWSFIKKAGTIILLTTIVIWFVSNYGFEGGKLAKVEDISNGFLAKIGMGFAFVFKPLGFGNWQSAVAAITGLVAKENVVSTFGILLGTEDISGFFTPLTAYSFLIFNLLCAPCFAAVGAIRREMNNGKWTLFALAYQTGLAYLVAFCIYQIGSLLIGGNFGIGTIIAIIAFAAFVYLLIAPSTPKQGGSYVRVYSK